MSKLDDIKRLYYDAKAGTIQRDLTRAIVLFKSLETEDERERAAVYMDGLSQMRSEWAAADKPGPTSSATRRTPPSSSPAAAGPRERSGRSKAASGRGR